MVSSAQAHSTTLTALDQAIGLHRAGRLAEALARYDRILAANPDDADALNLSGLVHLSQANAARAVQLISRAVKLAPHSPLFRYHLGTALAAAGSIDKAIAAFERALKLKPDMAEAWAALGRIRARHGEGRKAAHALHRAVKLDPRSADGWNNLALALAGLGELAEAREAIAKAIALKPDFALAHNSAGVLARAAGDLDASIAAFERALALDPAYFEARSNLAISLADAGRHEAAVAAFEAALALRDDHAETWRGAAKPLAALGDMERARAASARALRLAPDDRRAIWEKALIDLAAGHFADGWDGYRARPTADRARRPLPKAPLGRNLAGDTVVLEGEQGLGEELFFLRFAAPLADRGARVIARVDGRLVSMVARMPGIDEALPREGAGTRGKGNCFLLGDLPWLIEAGDRDFAPAPIAAVDELRAVVRARLAAAGPPPYVGLTWRAGAPGRANLHKEAPIELIAQAIAGREATPIALQRDPAAGEIDDIARKIGRPVADFTDLNGDLEAMLALMNEIGEYVAVSNTNVHLAAAARAAGADIEVHVLVPCPAEFRWLAAGAGSPWFPGFRVHREDARLGWAPARESLARAIARN